MPFRSNNLAHSVASRKKIPVLGSQGKEEEYCLLIYQELVFRHYRTVLENSKNTIQ